VTQPQPSGCRTCLGCFIWVVVIAFIVIKLTPDPPDKALPPKPKPKTPTLQTATLYVAGANGGPYKVSWWVRTPNGVMKEEPTDQATGVIKEEPAAYPIDLEGFTSDQHGCGGFICGDIDMEATKTEPWQGDLVVGLKVNGTLVECDTTSDTYPRHDPDGASIDFDPDNQEEYIEDAQCERDLET
jgi:hypothetical protein